MPATKPLGNFEVLGIRRRGFTSSITPYQAALAKYGRQAVLIEESPASGQVYSGYTPTLYAAPADLGAGDGSSEANAMDLATAITLIGNGSTGKVLGVLPGTYSGSVANSRWNVVFEPAYSGTSGDPVIIVAKYPAAYNYASLSNLSEIRNANYATQQNPVLGVGDNGVDYVRFIGFYADQTYAPPRASNGTFIIGTGSTGVTFEQCWVAQTVNSTADNYNAIFSENSVDAVIKNCRFTGGSGAGNHNAAAIGTYDAVNILIEHNLFDSNNQAIFIKGTTDFTNRNSGTIRYNYAVDCSSAFVDIAVTNASGVDVYQNLAVRCARGIVLDNSSPANTLGPVRAYNNTLVNMTGSGYNAESGMPLTGSTFERNIVAFLSSTSAIAVQLDGTLLLSSMSTVDDNLYFESGVSAQFIQNGTTSTGLSAWQTATSKESASAETNPNFTNAGADNYHRSSYSDGRGCYITGSETIGVEV